MKTWLAGTASSIGEVAWKICSRAQTASVMGITSRGVFVRIAPDRVIFVSLETYRSPLTITLADPIDRLRSLAIDAPVYFSDRRLIFPSIEVAISLPIEAAWRATPPVGTIQPGAEQLKMLCAITQAIVTRSRDGGWEAVLPLLLDLTDVSPLSIGQLALLEQLHDLRQAVQERDRALMLNHVASLLGQGRGLTPSGDDCASGLLLMLNRWHSDQDWSVFNRAVIEAAYRATTTISANLIECAAGGQGDERLIAVVDGVAAGSVSLDKCVDCVLDWGSSSGIDALVGMALAIV